MRSALLSSLKKSARNEHLYLLPDERSEEGDFFERVFDSARYGRGFVLADYLPRALLGLAGWLVRSSSRGSRELRYILTFSYFFIFFYFRGFGKCHFYRINKQFF